VNQFYFPDTFPVLFECYLKKDFFKILSLLDFILKFKRSALCVALFDVMKIPFTPVHTVPSPEATVNFSPVKVQ
jgi:hypothetical protein